MKAKQIRKLINFNSPDAAYLVGKNWRVSDGERASDPRYVVFVGSRISARDDLREYNVFVVNAESGYVRLEGNYYTPLVNMEIARKYVDCVLIDYRRRHVQS